MKLENCPCCSNHCPQDNLGCNRGKEYFSNNNGNMVNDSLENTIINDLRKCGRLLHHNTNSNFSNILANYSKEELQQFHELLKRFYDEIK